MSTARTDARLQLPASLERQLHDFRRRVWTIKSIEGLCAAATGLVGAYLFVFAADRVFETPVWLRWGMFVVAACSCALVPLCLYRWVWRQRRLEQLARLLGRRHPSIGDQMLGIIELVRNEFEQARSRALCEAAIQQVAVAAAKRDFRDSVPNPRHQRWALSAAAPIVLALAAAVMYPAAAANALQRFALPWQSIPRYTFTMVESLAERIVVAHGEPFTVSARLLEGSRWQPAQGKAQLGGQSPVMADLRDGAYEFSLPPQIDAAWLTLRIGDAEQQVRIEPMLRPELESIVAQICLPEYLERPKPLERDVRGGSLSVVHGSAISLVATINRRLSSASIDGQPANPSDRTFANQPTTIDASRKLALEWRDEHGLASQDPFTISITSREDEPPSLVCEDLPRQRVVLVSETLNFKVRAQDDFGVKQVGIQWQGDDKSDVSKPAQGERLLASGGSDKDTIELAGTFCASTLDIEPQLLNVRIFAEDYLPGRARVYSPTYSFYVLSAEQHYVWITEQLSKWHRQSLEVRDREMQLHHANQQLRMLSEEELDHPETRRRIEAQSAAERANGRRLTGLVASGEELVRQAMRNPEFGVGHLEKWAEMLAILKDISAQRMPNVADLLKQSSQAPGRLASAASKPGPTAGQARDAAAAGVQPAESKPRPPVPQVVDSESSQQPPKPHDEDQSPSKSKSNPRLRLPVTTIADPGSKKSPQTPEAGKLDDAVVAQQDLLAEFEKIADELNKVLANLEGSTLVKRLKAAAREQYAMAGKIGDQLDGAFGHRGNGSDPERQALQQVAEQQITSSQKLSTIMDDMQAYFERRRYQRFKTVLDEMRQEDAVGSLRQLSDDVRVESGMSMAQCEFWSDTFDRWADNLVDPACAGKCPGCKAKGSLAPSIVLEAMQILEAEVNLREETRVAEQARPGLASADYEQRAAKLRTTQDALSERIAKLAVRIRELPDGEQDFAKEIALLGRVEIVMDDASEILGQPETGRPAIAAETEAIELLLQSKRINPRAGGGAGSSPGGGGTGTTTDSALALIGTGMNDKEVREDRGVSQSTGESGASLPEEFRAGLDEYFNRLERDDAQPLR